MKLLFHITTRAAWDRAQGAGEYRAESLATEGFIHLSTEDQWRHTLQRFYRGVPDLVILRIDPARLAGPLRYEPAHGEDFPHLYGPLATAAVVSIRDAPRLLQLPAGFEDRVLAADPAIAGVTACAVVDHGRFTTYLVLAAKPGRAGQISLTAAIQAGAPDFVDAGWMQLYSWPLQPDGTLDEVALLAYVESLLEDD
ncbi:MAG: DUF952 domain-containing protein [Kofleriaceae bacterium]